MPNDRAPGTTGVGMQPGTWTIRLKPDSTATDLDALAVLLSDELRRGFLLAVSSSVLAALRGGTAPPSGAAFPVRVGDDTSHPARVRFVQALAKTGAVDSALGIRGAPIHAVTAGITSEARWRTSDNPYAMLRTRVADDRKLRLFGCACCRFAWPSLADGRSRAAVEVSEQFADGLAAASRLAEAHDAANAAIREMPERLRESPAFLACSAAAAAASTAYPKDASIAASNALIEASDWEDGAAETRVLHADLLRDILGNPFRRVRFEPSWRSEDAVLLAKAMYEARDFSGMPVLADALEESGCNNDEVLNHCRTPGVHVRGCHVVDLVLGKA